MDRKITINNLILEVTRRCNLKCKHCLRGPAENLSLGHGTVVEALHQLDAIGSITFTGGEPSLVPEVLKMIRGAVSLRQINVENFYIATNGITNDKYDHFMIEIFKWWMLCSDNEISSVDISRDQWHKEVPPVEHHPLGAFRFTGERSIDSRPPFALINEGRTKRMTNLPIKSFGEMTFSRINCRRNIRSGSLIRSSWKDNGIEHIHFDDESVYINVHGDVILGCDFSYKSQDKLKIGNVHSDNLVELLESHSELEEI